MRVRTFDHLARALRPLLAAACVAAALWPAPAAHAAAYTYSTQQRTVNAGILLVDDPNFGDNDPPSGTNVPGASNPDPYIFYIFNKRNDLKPFGWNVVNPLAPPTVTGDIMNRWNVRPTSNGTAGGASSGYYHLNDLITPDMAPYWEVSLSKTTLANLLQYDVLLLNLGTGHTVQLTDDEVHRLRRFVDAGGQLLVECSGGTLSSANGLFFSANFNTGGGSPFLIPATNTTLLRHPIIASPYLLSQQELNSLGPLNQSVSDSAFGLPLTPLLDTVLNSRTGKPSLVAAQYGAGQIVLDATGSLAILNDAVPGIASGYGTAFGYNNASNSGPRCEGPFTAAPAADLKLLADILAWTGAHPNEHKNSHQSSQSPAVVGPALSPTWTYTPGVIGTYAPGAAINGSFVYVRGADGFLHAFNATPGTDILGTGDPDAGPIKDYDSGTPQDEIWNHFVGASASAPTVAAYGGVTYVLIEDAGGLVHIYNATDGTSPTATGVPSTVGISGKYGNFAALAPAPTFYDGRIYAGQEDGSLYVCDLVAGHTASTPGLDVPLGGAVGAVIAPPTVGIVRQNYSGPLAGASAYSDDVVATVATITGVYTVELGSYHDPLLPGGTNYSVHNVSGTPFSVDAPYDVYDLQTYPGYKNPITGATPTSSNSNSFLNAFNNIGSGAAPYYADYGVDFVQYKNGSYYALNRSQFGYGGAGTALQVSAPALTANGTFYYTININSGNSTAGNSTDSTLVCAHDSRTNGTPAARMQWRFRLPYSSERGGSDVDADGVSYDNLAGYQFIGAPVVDRNDNVFALASNGSQVAVLCFSGDQRVTAQITAPGAGNAQVTSLTQTVIGGTKDEFTNAAPTAAQPGQQYTNNVDADGRITLLSFGTTTGSIPGTNPTLTPNICEPEPVSVVLSFGGAGGGAPMPALLHTNLLWYGLLPTSTAPATPTAGLTLVGNYLYYGDGVGRLVRVSAYPQNAGLVTAKVASFYNMTTGTVTTDSDGRATVASTQTGVGPIGGVPSAGNGVLVINGTAGVAAFGSQNTIVADANRVVELDADGVATWAVDATTLTNANATTTHLDLNHPSAVTQITPNDYLVADTGNSRCVRFDRSGNVLWELTRLNDTTFTSSSSRLTKPNRLLAPGEPTTLNHPSSVDSYTDTSVADTTNGGNYTIQHYLIADTGNYRVLDVVDVYNGLGTLVGQPHNLVWISHTYDAQHRQYSYTGANYYHSYQSGFEYVAAVISNVRVAPLTGTVAAQAALPVGTLAPATADAPGSSLVLLDYDPTRGNTTFQKDGYIGVGQVTNAGTTTNELRAFSSFTALINNDNTFDLTLDNTGALTGATVTGTARTIYLRNPRFLQTYTNKSATSGLTHFLLADDNGVFDLIPSSAANPPLRAVWGFTQADYSNVTTPIDAITLATVDPVTKAAISSGFDRTHIPFIPTSLSRPTSDAVTIGTSQYTIGHYIVTNGYSQGQVTPGAVVPTQTIASQKPTTFGGEVLELHAAVNGSTLTTQEIHGSVGPFTGMTLSKPTDTSPLSRPAFAAREK